MRQGARHRQIVIQRKEGDGYEIETAQWNSTTSPPQNRAWLPSESSTATNQRGLRRVHRPLQGALPTVQRIDA